jgi:hypothetical protein
VIFVEMSLDLELDLEVIIDVVNGFGSKGLYMGGKLDFQM